MYLLRGGQWGILETTKQRQNHPKPQKKLPKTKTHKQNGARTDTTGTKQTTLTLILSKYV